MPFNFDGNIPNRVSIEDNAIVGRNIGNNLEIGNKNNEKYLMIFFIFLILIQPLGLATAIDNIGLLLDSTFHDTFIPPFGIFCFVFGIPFAIVCLVVGLIKFFFNNKILNYLFYIIFGIAIFLVANYIFCIFTNSIILSFLIAGVVAFIFFIHLNKGTNNG